MNAPTPTDVELLAQAACRFHAVAGGADGCVCDRRLAGEARRACIAPEIFGPMAAAQLAALKGAHRLISSPTPRLTSPRPIEAAAPAIAGPQPQGDPRPGAKIPGPEHLAYWRDLAIAGIAAAADPAGKTAADTFAKTRRRKPDGCVMPPSQFWIGSPLTQLLNIGKSWAIWLTSERAARAADLEAACRATLASVEALKTAAPPRRWDLENDA